MSPNKKTRVEHQRNLENETQAIQSHNRGLKGQARRTYMILKVRQTKTECKDTRADKLARNPSIPNGVTATRATAKDSKFHEKPNCPSKHTCNKDVLLHAQKAGPQARCVLQNLALLAFRCALYIIYTYIYIYIYIYISILLLPKMKPKICCSFKPFF